MGKLGNFICPDCNKDCGNPNALKLHKSYCKKDKPKECEHEYKLLNPKNLTEEKALQQGFLQVCKHCKELL